jgi:hypothetical protein
MKSSLMRAIRLMDLARGTRRLGIVLAVAVLATAAQAQSGWSKLARTIATKATEYQEVEPADAQQPGELQGVPDENGQFIPVRQGAGAQRVASLGESDAMPLTPGAPEDDSAYNRFGKQLDLGLESEDQGALSATNLLNNPDIARLLGDNPRFTYKATGLQDPMLVPWARNAAIFTEMSAKAEAGLQANDLNQAADCYKRILDLNDVRFHSMALAKLNEIASLKNERALSALSASNEAIETPVDLPGWVLENTTAVILSPSQDLCMVGEYMLSVGDTLPNYPEISVSGIERDKVHYRIKSKTFEVELTNR